MNYTFFSGTENGNYVNGSFVKDKTTRNIEIGILKPFLKGKDIQRYSSPEKQLFILFPYFVSASGKSQIMNESDIMTHYPNAYQWLKETESLHRKKDNGSTNDEHWYRYARNQGIDYIEKPKISSMEICANHPNVILDFNNYYHNTKVYSWYKSENTRECYEYLLAIANSKLLWWFLKTTGDTLQGDARTFKTNYLNPFPLPLVVDPVIENQLAQKVKDVLSIKKFDSSDDTSNLESEIDAMVYDLYGLTKDEIGVVESA